MGLTKIVPGDDRSIKQIIPAGGWWARYHDDEGQYVLPLAMFALMSDGSIEGRRAPFGELQRCEDEDFDGYLTPDEGAALEAVNNAEGSE